MSRVSTTLTALAALMLLPALPSHAFAANYNYGFDTDAKDPFGWALVRDGHTSSSDLNGLDEIKDRYGDDFLYIRDGGERWVIRDNRLMKRAEEDMKPIQDAGREIGAAVGAKVGYSMRRSQGTRERARLERRISRLESRIERDSERGEDTKDMEQEMEGLQRQLDQMKEDRWRRHQSDEREADLDAATERASRHMRDATRKLRQDLRDILREAKNRHLAEPVED